MINPNYQPIPTFPQPTYPITTVIENWIGRTAAPRLCLQPTHSPKTLPGGEKINKGDLTIPPTLAKMQSTKKNTHIQSSDKLEENLDKIMTKKLQFEDDRMELKIIPFKYVGKNK